MAKLNKVTKADITALQKILGEANVLTGEAIVEEYGKDELGTVFRLPDVVVIVRSTADVSQVAKYANEHLLPLTVRGSGTGLVGACVPTAGGILIDMTKMNKIVNLDEANLVLEVEPGALLMDIASYVEERGYFYAPDPGEKSATIGGNVATNAGGMRAVKYGVTRDWIRAMEVVLPNGAVEMFGRVVAKNSTGYSLKDLVIGSEGTLCIITKLYLRLAALPDSSISVLVPFPDFKTAISSVPKLLIANLTPTAIEFFDQETLEFAEKFLGKNFPDRNYPAYILLTFDGATKEAVHEQMCAGADLMLDKLGCADALIVDTTERKEDVWSARGAFLEAIKASTTMMDECDVVVPREKIADFILYTKQLSKEYGIRIPSFGHAGDGNLHVYLCKDELSDAVWDKMLPELFTKLYRTASEMGGLASGEHGIGYAKRTYMAEMLGKNQVEIMRGIKRVFDPNGILNPDKVI